VDNDIDGRLFTPGDIDELAGAIADMAAHPKRLIDMGRAGRRKIERHYGPISHYTALMDVYNQAACDR
jgi:glycosyltransferase involved in cell wall biosynthesis